MLYVKNPKHRDPWQRGRRGTLCPRLEPEVVQGLLDASEPDGEGADAKRYSVLDGSAYCAKRHEDDKFHGWPVPWREVPERLWRKWLAEGKVASRQLSDGW
jgi:hypothetical protein